MSYQMLKPGGTMVYSTCSFSYEEDEEVIDYLLDNSDAQIIEIENNPLYYKSQGKGIHLLPSLFPGEGHYIALIKKPGTCLSTHFEKVENKSQIKTKYPNVCKYGDYLFAMSEKINTKLLNIVRYGVKIGGLNKDEIKYDHHYAHSIHEFSSEIEISFEDLLKYYQGESLNYQISKGYVLLKYQDRKLLVNKFARKYFTCMCIYLKKIRDLETDSLKQKKTDYEILFEKYEQLKAEPESRIQRLIYLNKEEDDNLYGCTMSDSLLRDIDYLNKKNRLGKDYSRHEMRI